MLVVRVELHSAITGKVTEIARMDICNVGGSHTRGEYEGRAYRGRNKDALNKRVVQRTGQVHDYPRLAIHVWNLVGRMLWNMSYGIAGKK